MLCVGVGISCCFNISKEDQLRIRLMNSQWIAKWIYMTLRSRQCETSHSCPVYHLLFCTESSMKLENKAAVYVGN